MYITQVLQDFDSKVESSLFPFMVEIGFGEYYHSTDDKSNAFSKYEFKKGKDTIIIYLGLNRLDYNSGIHVSLYTLGEGHKSLHELLGRTDSYGYSEELLERSMQAIKTDLSKALRTTERL